MLRDIVESLLRSQRDMYIAGELPARDGLSDAIGRARPDVVLLGLPSGDVPPFYNELLYAHPTLRLLAVTGDGRSAYRYELRPQRSPVGEVSPQGLLDAIRAAARGPESVAPVEDDDDPPGPMMIER